MPLTPEWAAFFTAELGALAALTGFVVVAISINLSRILSFPSLPGRAGEALVGPIGAITATSLVLIPEQPHALLGAEIVLVALALVVAPIAVQARTCEARKEATTTERVIRAVTSSGVGLAFAVGGALVFFGLGAGLYWIAAGDVLFLIAVVFNAWVLMVEILR